jgi:hypothetical protein
MQWTDDRVAKLHARTVAAIETSERLYAAAAEASRASSGRRRRPRVPPGEAAPVPEPDPDTVGMRAQRPD